jgi:hypothetical protein
MRNAFQLPLFVRFDVFAEMRAVRTKAKVIPVDGLI